MALAKKRKVEQPRTAAGSRKIVRTTVASPYNHGIDRPERVMDTIEVMFRRRMIDGRQKEAADKYRGAFDALTQSMGGSMDMEKARGGGTPGAPPCPASLVAADIIDEAAKELGPADHTIVEMVCGSGYSVEETAAATLDKAGLSERDHEYTGRRLRDALTRLANMWSPTSKGSRIRGHIADGAKPSGGRAGTRDVLMRIAHATTHGVRFSDEEKARK